MTDEPESPATDRRIQPARRRNRESRHGGLAAVDFGTTNSTVTLYDPYFPPPVLPLPTSQHAALSQQTVRLLRDEPRSDELVELRVDHSRAEWSALRERLTAEFADGRSSLADAVEAEESANGALLYRILLALDVAQAGGTAPFAMWLADRLHDCYDKAFGTPALEHHSLFPVRLDSATDQDEVPSRLDVTAVDPALQVRLGRPLGDGATLATTRGLKHHLDKPDFHLDLRDDARKVGLEALLGGAFGFLLDRTDEFTSAHPERLEPAPIDHVVATYPTMAPPVVRRRLERVITGLLGVGEVDLRYDEAIAAALFFLMRDLGANYALGVEALRARFRSVAGENRHWIENTLVIDIGGGTTDIALVTTHLHDKTPELPGAPAGTIGRYYRLVPQLRGTSGRTRRGGDFLTLQVFHLLKAIIADHLLTTDHPGEETPSDDLETWQEWQRKVTARLDPSCLSVTGDYPAGGLVAQARVALRRDTAVPDTEAGQRSRDNAERVVATRSSQTDGELAGRDEAFTKLWDLAEEAKIRVSRDQKFRLPADVVEDIARAVVEVPSSVPPGFGGGMDGLTYDDFVGVTEPMLIEISRLAGALARARLGADDRLDRVILTGKASQLALAAEVVARELAADESRAGPPVQVVVERTYAKNAASMGAAWAAAMSSLGAPEPDEELLRQGATEVSIEVDNLLLDLPCTLSMRGRADHKRTLLPAGTAFQELADGRLRAFATVGRLGDRLIVEREVDGGQPVPWGAFRWSDLDVQLAQTNPGLRLNPEVWPTQIRAGVEVDGALNLDLLLWRGERACYLVGQGSPCLRVPAEMCDGRIDVRELADRLYVAGRPDVDPCPALRPDGRTPPSDETFVDEYDNVRAGVLGRAPLPPPDEDGRWAFLLHDEAGHRHLLGRLSTEPGARVPHLLSLDEEGAIRVHAGDPPFWTTDSTLDLENRPGIAFRYRLGTPRTETDDHDNPFDGTH